MKEMIRNRNAIVEYGLHDSRIKKITFAEDNLIFAVDKVSHYSKSGEEHGFEAEVIFQSAFWKIAGFWFTMVYFQRKSFQDKGWPCRTLFNSMTIKNLKLSLSCIMAIPHFLLAGYGKIKFLYLLK